MIVSKRNQNIKKTMQQGEKLKESFCKERELWNNWVYEETVKEDKSSFLMVFKIIRRVIWTIIWLLVIVRMVRGFEYVSCRHYVQIHCVDEFVRKYTPVCSVKCDFEKKKKKSWREYVK